MSVGGRPEKAACVWGVCVCEFYTCTYVVVCYTHRTVHAHTTHAHTRTQNRFTHMYTLMTHPYTQSQNACHVRMHTHTHSQTQHSHAHTQTHLSATSLVFGVPLVDLVTREGKNIPTIVQKIVEHVEEEGEGWREGEG